MSRARIGAALLTVLGLAAAVSAQGTFPLKYVDGPVDLASLAVSPDAPPATLNAPPGTRDAPLATRDVSPATRPVEFPKGFAPPATVFRVPLGGREILFVLDGSKPPKLYVDTDRDGAIADETAFESVAATRPGADPDAMRRGEYGPVCLPGAAPGGAVRLSVSTRDGESLHISPAGLVRGRVKINGKKLTVGVVDGDFDGRYDTVAKFPLPAGEESQSDWFALDLNGDGKLADEYGSASERFPLPRMTSVDGSWYRIKVAPDGSSVELAKTEPRFGTLDLGTPDAQISLRSENGPCMLKGGDGKYRLPAGRYAADSLRLARADLAGHRWTLDCYRDTGKLREFEIVEGAALTLRFGAPLTAGANVSATGNTVVVGLKVTGSGGEEYYGGVEADGRRQSAPRVSITGEAGQTLAAGQFEYG